MVEAVRFELTLRIGGGMVESNSNRFRDPSVFKTVLGPAQITLRYS